ncbi:MAG TPA: hypothetical protein VIT20_00850 [Propionibacteriaceae bacterium]
MSAVDDGGRRIQERRALAHEVSDAVTSRLATVSLQVMSHLDAADLSDLRQALRSVGGAVDAALAELRVLARVLRDEPPPEGRYELAGLVPSVVPTTSGREWERRLSAAGYVPTIVVPDESDRLGKTTQRTICRVLDVNGDHVLSHAIPGSACSATVVLYPAQVIVRTSSLQSPDQPAQAVDHGLIGLRERIDLIGGTIAVGSQTEGPLDWAILVTFPRC